MSAASKTPIASARAQTGAPLLSVRGLTVGFPAAAGTAVAVQGVSLDVLPGETLGIVGESGCGKSLTLRALLGLVPEPGRILAGEATWKGDADLLRLSRQELQAVRGREIAMIFQDPLESLNPVFSVGNQLTEVLTKRAGLSRADARKRAIELLDRVGIPSASVRMQDYPHQLSGGMRQRVMIALALACDPQLLMADEPTTALDVTIQDQILMLLGDLQQAAGLSMILVSHDLGVIAQVADRVVVMYAGHVVETGPVDEVLSAPRHPYTAGLIASSPQGVGGSTGARLEAIGGSPPALADRPPGCPFAPRCGFATDRCAEVDMRLHRSGERASACPFVDMTAREVAPHGR